MGFPDISRLAHAMEDLVGLYRQENAGPVVREQVDLLFLGIDTISEMTRFATQRGDEGPGTPYTELIQPENITALISKLLELAGTPEHEPARHLLIPETLTPPENYQAETVSTGITVFSSNGEAAASDWKIEQAGTGKQDSRSEETIRVRLDKLDSMINLAGELVINKIQNEEHLENLQAMLSKNRQRSRLLSQLREFLVEQIPLEERSRLLGITELFSFGDEELKVAKAAFLASRHSANGGSNSSNGIATSSKNMVLDGRSIRKIYDKLEQLAKLDQEIEQNLGTILRERKRYNITFETTSDELRRYMLGIRMLPLSTLFNRFNRLVRDLEKELGKKVKLAINGGNVEIDKRILEEIADPLIHLVRNAIDHGIETPEQRRATGKTPEGSVTISASQRGNHVHIGIADDGRGLDPENLLQTALNKGFIKPEDSRQISDDVLYDMIFRSGFTTRQTANEHSGRGVGLDVVYQNIKRLSGRVLVHSQKGLGATFTMEIPLTLATIDALLVRISGQLFAIPSTLVETTLRLPRQEIITVEGRPAIRVRDQVVPLVNLSQVLSLTPTSRQLVGEIDADYMQGVLVSIASGGGANQEVNMERFIYFEVDELVDEREVVVKGLGKFLEKVPNIAGATVLGADGLALILDVFGLVQTVRTGSATPYMAQSGASNILTTIRPNRILVVDDSLATRELERSILETAGYEVETARDGIEALHLCQQQEFDLVLTDIEMPNMDGFKLSLAISENEKLRHIPVIVVSSRDSEQDKRRGLQSGAKAYIVKGQFEQNKLLETISRLIA
jgi:chemotaxis protein histidine kinase CheA